MVTPQDKLSEKWPWNGEFLRIFLFVPSLMGIAASVALYSTAGVHALWFLTGILAGVVFYTIFGVVGRRVDRLKDQLKEESGEWAEGLLVIGKIHSPGLVVLRSAEVELIPIVGKRCILPLNQIDFIKEGRWLPGKFVWGKRAFNFQTSIGRPLAFAVAESIGARWSVALRNRVAR